MGGNYIKNVSKWFMAFLHWSDLKRKKLLKNLMMPCIKQKRNMIIGFKARLSNSTNNTCRIVKK